MRFAVVFCCKEISGLIAAQFYGVRYTASALLHRPDPEYALCAHVGFAYGLFEILFGVHRFVVHLNDDVIFRYATLFHLAVAHSNN